MTWTTSILLAVLCLTGHLIAVRIIGEKLPSTFATPAFYTFAIITLFAIFLFERPEVPWNDVAKLSIILPLILAGVTIGLTDLFFVKSINLGGDISTLMPMLVGGATILIFIVAFVVFKEPINLIKALGLVFAVSGIIMIYKG